MTASTSLRFISFCSVARRPAFFSIGASANSGGKMRELLDVPLAALDVMLLRGRPAPAGAHRGRDHIVIVLEEIAVALKFPERLRDSAATLGFSAMTSVLDMSGAGN